MIHTSLEKAHPSTYITEATCFEVISSVQQAMLVEDTESHQRFLVTPNYEAMGCTELQTLPKAGEKLTAAHIEYLGKMKEGLDKAPDFYQADLSDSQHHTLTYHLARL